MSNTLKRGKSIRKYGWYRKLRHKQQLSRYLFDKSKKNRKYKNPRPDEEIIEGSWSDKSIQKEQNNKNKIDRREKIRRLRKQKEKQRRRFLDNESDD